MTVITWVLDQLNVKTNAPRWAGIAVAAFTGWLAAADVDLDASVQAALVLVVTVFITTVVQKVATLARADAE